MRERASVMRVLTAHFFRRFFDNDTVQVEGDTITTVARAWAAVAAPGLMVAFFIQNQYPRRSLWGSIQDQCFFVLLSFVAMGAVTIFEWEMLFPDRLDFLVLTPLPVKLRQMLAAKASALAGFVLLFLVGANVFGMLIYPAVCKGNFPRQLLAHGAAVLLAGLFAALISLAVSGVLLCVLDGARFRAISPLLQTMLIAGLALLMLGYLKYGDGMEAMLAHGARGGLRWVPPLWFLGVYDRLLYGDKVPQFAAEMARYALRGTAIAAVVAGVTYPLAWARMRKLTMEGVGRSRREDWRWLAGAIHGLIRRPAERAVFHFIGQTMRRNNCYQVYLAMYGGIGLALAVACAVTMNANAGGMTFGVSRMGLHATMPLLLFWVIAGLRLAFGFPLNLAAGWVFRVSGAAQEDCARAAARWVLGCAIGVMATILVVLAWAGWDARQLPVQAVCGLCLCVLLTDGFFFTRSIPFNQPRMPGKTNFPLMLTLYVGVLGPYVYGVMALEMRLEKTPQKLLLLAAGTLLLHAGIARLKERPMEIEEEMEGYEGEFQLLGLS